MSNWASGYVTDIGYTHGYYAELNPLRLPLAFGGVGLLSPQVKNVCELGFGQGVSLAMHATTQHNVTYWGTDFNPSHALHAQNLMNEAGVHANIFDQSFEEFCTRDDLPEFECIYMHGIWSWISESNCRLIVDFIRRKLKVGGVLYISYNTQPGWAAMVPVRHILTQYETLVSSHAQGITARVTGALDFFDQFLALQPKFIQANPLIENRYKLLRNQNPNYLAHEYFNKDWHPIPFSEMHDWLDTAKLSFACSAHLPDHIDTLNLTNEQFQFLNNISDKNFRESMRDMITNQQFRRDYWLKGVHKYNMLSRADALNSIKIVMTIPSADISLKMQGSLGEGEMNPSQYNPVIELLSNYEPIRLSDLLNKLTSLGHKLTLSQLTEICFVLISKGAIHVVNPESQSKQVIQSAAKLNLYLMKQARTNSDIGALVCPLIGGGLMVGHIDQLMLLALHEKHQTTAEIEKFVWGVLSLQGRKFHKDGQVLQTESENLSELNRLIILFKETKYPLYKKLGLCS